MSGRPETGRALDMQVLPQVCLAAVLSALLLVATACASPRENGDGAPPRVHSYPVPPEMPVAIGAADYAPAIEELERVIREEMEEKQIPALSISLVEGSETVWSRGFGDADPRSGEPAAPSMVHRVGSVSKLFTDIAVMRLLERQELELDVPVARYLPEFSEDDAVGAATLRQLMTHRSGIVREPPVGNYFDATEPGLAATVSSLEGLPAVYRAGERVKYSNAAIAVVGRVVEEVTGAPFAEFVRREILAPFGMHGSGFEPGPEIRASVPEARMWAYDRADWEAPTFDLGMSPAGNLYAPVTDLARFLSALFAGGMGPEGRVLRPETLDSMWAVQFAGPDARRGFGLGFLISELEGLRRVSHGGWLYGFATEVAALPQPQLGVAVVATVDGSNAVVERIADRALRLMLAARSREDAPAIEDPRSIDDAAAGLLLGRYGTEERWLELDDDALRGELFQVDGQGGARLRLAVLGDTLITDGRLDYGRRALPITADGRPALSAGDTAAALVVLDDTLPRLPYDIPPPPPAEQRELIGEYGPDHNVLYVLERDGELHLLIEWFFYEPLLAESPDRFRLPDRGLYAGEAVRFERSGGEVSGVRVGGVFFPRRELDDDGEDGFRIDPVRPVEELRPIARAAEPPQEDDRPARVDLVELRELDPTIRYDIRYATENNFMGAVFYREPHAYLQRPAARAVVRAGETLREHGFGLLVYDAYRPWFVTKMFWDATPQDLKMFVADPASGSRHNRGAAVDLGLYDLETGEPLLMPSGYDEFTSRAFAHYPGGAERQRYLRNLLRHAMEAEGFVVYSAEWWHFDHRTWSDYPILNLTFEELD